MVCSCNGGVLLLRSLVAENGWPCQDWSWGDAHIKWAPCPVTYPDSSNSSPPPHFSPSRVGSIPRLFPDLQSSMSHRKPRPVPSMAFNSRERPPSSSSLPETEGSSSSSLSHSYEQSERQSTAKLRRHEVVDGQQIWIFESPRRRRRKVPKCHRPEDAHRCPQPSMDTGIVVMHDGSHGVLEKRPTLDSSSLPANDDLQPAPPLSKRSIADQARQHGSIVSTSEMASKFMADHEDLTSPPPTPKIARLKTPDLPPLKMRLFCDCQPCQQTSCGTKRVIVLSGGGISQTLWP